MNQSHYNQIEIVEKLDIKAYLLRFWESEFEIIKPIISDAGVKLYTPKDFSILNRIKELLIVEKHSLYKAKSILEREFNSFDSQYITTEENEYTEEITHDYNLNEEQADENVFEEVVVNLDSKEEDEIEEIEEPKSSESFSSMPSEKLVEEIKVVTQKEVPTPVISQEKVIEVKVIDYSLLDKAMELLAVTKNSISTFKSKLEI